MNSNQFQPSTNTAPQPMEFITPLEPTPNTAPPSTTPAETTPPNNIRVETINTPPAEDFNTEALRGSFQQILSENIGLYAVIDFLIGTTEMTRISGYIYGVGRSILTIYDDVQQVFVTCDMFSIKFVAFLLPGQHTPGTPSPIPVTPIPYSDQPTAPTMAAPSSPTISSKNNARMRRFG